MGDVACNSIDELARGFRKHVFAGIAKALAQGGSCKSYEGAVELTVSWPNYFEETTGRNWGLTAVAGGTGLHGMHFELKLHCYVLGPSRHYEWTGADVEDVFARATADVTRWTEELVEE